MTQMQKRALGGSILWGLLLVGLPGVPRLHLIEMLFLLAPLVVAPLGLEAVATPDRNQTHSVPYRLARQLQPAAALLLLPAFLLPPGAMATGLAIGWALFTVLMALHGLWRLLPRGLFAIEEVAIDTGLIYLAVGGGWLLLSRAGFSPLGFAEPIVLLTAVHFHFAGFAAPVVTGLAGRLILATAPHQAKLYRIIVAAVAASMPLVAVGLTFASTTLEMAGAALFTAGLSGLVVLCICYVLPRGGMVGARLLLAVSASSVLLSMLLACLYAGGRLIGYPVLSITAMARTHGILNAFGFSLCGLLGLLLLHPRARVDAPGIRFSHLRSRGRVGADFFERSGTALTGQAPPQGLVAKLAEYRSLQFDPSLVHPAVRGFFEESERFDLAVRATWAPGFRTAGRLWARVASRLGQLLLPVATGERLIHCRLLPLDERCDGRPGARGSVRVAAGTGAVHQVAAYAVQGDDRARYMATAFPLPGGNLSSIHRLELFPLASTPQPEGAKADHLQGLILTTLPGEQRPGDEGVWFANPWLPLRLPVDDRIRLWPTPPEAVTAGDESSVTALHEMWLFGIRFLTLDYRILPARSGN